MGVCLAVNPALWEFLHDLVERSHPSSVNPCGRAIQYNIFAPQAERKLTMVTKYCTLSELEAEMVAYVGSGRLLGGP